MSKSCKLDSLNHAARTVTVVCGGESLVGTLDYAEGWLVAVWQAGRFLGSYALRLATIETIRGTVITVNQMPRMVGD